MTTTQNPTLSRRLILQGESDKATPCGVYYGRSLYEVTGDGTVGYEFVLHARTYDGIRVSSKWDSGVVRLNATTKEEAVAESVEQYRSLIRSMYGVGDEGGRE